MLNGQTQKSDIAFNTFNHTPPPRGFSIFTHTIVCGCKYENPDALRGVASCTATNMSTPNFCEGYTLLLFYSPTLSHSYPRTHLPFHPSTHIFLLYFVFRVSIFVFIVGEVFVHKNFTNNLFIPQRLNRIQSCRSSSRIIPEQQSNNKRHSECQKNRKWRNVSRNTRKQCYTIRNYPSK